MKTQAPEKTNTTESASWWDRATDTEASANRGKRLLTIAIIIALGIAAFMGIKGFMGSQEAEARDNISDLIFEGELLLPSPEAGSFYGRIPDVGFFFRTETASLRNAGKRRSALGDAARGRGPEKSLEYLKKIEEVLANFNDKEADALTDDQAWQFMSVRQQLCWYAAVNSTDIPKRIQLLGQQLAHLEVMIERWPTHPVLSMIADPVGRPGKTLMAIWQERATAEKAFWEANPEIPAVLADENLSATMTLDNGKKLEIEFFSFIAPRAVANFVKLAKDGFYDGTAFHAISETSCDGGNPLSKLCPNRPRVWKKGSVGYVLPRDEATSVMDTSAGAISLTMDIGGYHGSHFSIHTADNPGTTFAAHTIFARVTKGLDAIQEYVKTDTIDDEQSENPNLPIVPLRITSLVVTGEPTHQTDDSWVPLFIEPEVPEQTDEEKRVEKEAKKKASEGDKEDKKDEEKEPAKSGK